MFKLDPSPLYKEFKTVPTTLPFYRGWHGFGIPNSSLFKLWERDYVPQQVLIVISKHEEALLRRYCFFLG
jgi:hypothetical protein